MFRSGISANTFTTYNLLEYRNLAFSGRSILFSSKQNPTFCPTKSKGIQWEPVRQAPSETQVSHWSVSPSNWSEHVFLTILQAVPSQCSSLVHSKHTPSLQPGVSSKRAQSSSPPQATHTLFSSHFDTDVEGHSIDVRQSPQTFFVASSTSTKHVEPSQSISARQTIVAPVLFEVVCRVIGVVIRFGICLIEDIAIGC